jgi:hypothetical protein
MKLLKVFGVIACVGFCSSLFVALPGIADQNNNSNGTQEDKARQEYEKHVKEAEKEHQRQEKQAQSAGFKSNVRKAIEHGHAQHH